MVARSDPLALERRTLWESDSAHGVRILHLAFAGEGGGKTERIRPAYAVRPIPIAHKKATRRGLTSASAKKPLSHEGGDGEMEIGMSG